MAWDLGSIAAVVGGELRPGAGLVASTPVDAVVRLDEFVVLGHRFYATLVVASVDALVAALRAGDDRAAALSGAALLAGGGQGDLSALTANRDLCVIAVPEPEPDLLYARLVALLASDRAAEDRLVTTGTKVLTQVARRGGAEAVVAELAHRIDGWAVLLDAHGQVITTAAAGGLHVKDAVAVAFQPARAGPPSRAAGPSGRLR